MGLLVEELGVGLAVARLVIVGLAAVGLDVGSAVVCRCGTWSHGAGIGTCSGGTFGCGTCSRGVG